MFFGKKLSHIKNILLFVFPTIDLWLARMVHTAGKTRSIIYQCEDHNWPNIKEHHVPGNLK